MSANNNVNKGGAMNKVKMARMEKAFRKYMNMLSNNTAWRPSKRNFLRNIERGQIGNRRAGIGGLPRIEVDKVEGGFKANVPRQMRRYLTVNTGFEMVAVRDNQDAQWRYMVSTNNPFNLMNNLKNDTEYLRWLEQATQVKFLSYGITFNYSRIPQAGENFPEMYLLYQTDKVDPTMYNSLTNEKVAMKWDMNSNGKKVYNGRFTGGNTEKEKLQWQPADNIQYPELRIYIDNLLSTLQPTIESENNRVQLGRIEARLRVVFRIADLKDAQAKIKGGQDELMEELQQLRAENQLYKEIRTKEKQEIKELVKNGKTKEEAIKLVRHWDELTISEDN